MFGSIESEAGPWDSNSVVLNSSDSKTLRESMGNMPLHALNNDCSDNANHCLAL